MIVCAGEALIDMVETSVQNQVCFIPKPGGSPYNTAIAAARAGGTVGYCGAISEDSFGKLLQSRLEADRVSLKFVKPCREPSALAFVQIQDGEPDYSFYFTGTSMMVFDPAMALTLTHELTTGSCVMFGSISLVLEPIGTMYEALLLELSAQQNSPLIAFDPNIRPMVIRDKDKLLMRFEQFIKHADIVKVSQADLSYLMPELSFESALESLAARGPVLVIGTKGAHGTLGIKRCRDGSLVCCDVPARSVKVADTIGAGDTFHGAFLAILEQMDKLERDALSAMTEAELVKALNFAVCASALVCTRYGAEPPVLEEITALLPQ